MQLAGVIVDQGRDEMQLQIGAVQPGLGLEEGAALGAG